MIIINTPHNTSLLCDPSLHLNKYINWMAARALWEQQRLWFLVSAQRPRSEQMNHSLAFGSQAPLTKKKKPERITHLRKREKWTCPLWELLIFHSYFHNDMDHFPVSSQCFLARIDWLSDSGAQFSLMSDSYKSQSVQIIVFPVNSKSASKKKKLKRRDRKTN